MGTKARRWGIALLAVGAAAGVAAALAVTHVRSERASVEGSRDLKDVAFLDEYADELRIVMSRARGLGVDAESFARRVDGPGPDIETLEVSGAYEEGAEVVLRLRRERVESGGWNWMGGHGQPYEISACYRWRFGPGGDEGPDRLAECPDTPVIDLGPPPVTPTLPSRIADILHAELDALVTAGGVSEPAVADAVRSAYADAVDEALAEPGSEPESLLRSGDVLGPTDEWLTTVDGVIGVALGQDRSCVLAQVSPDGARVWHPPRISLEPGEVGCSAGWAAHGGDL